MHKKVQIVIFRALPSFETKSSLKSAEKSRLKYQVLLLQTNEKRGLFWQNVTGSLEAQESFLEAAKRELFEECAYRSSVSDTGKEDYFTDRMGEKAQERIFYCKLNHTEEAIDPILSHEHKDFLWKDADQIQDHDYKYPSNFKAFSLCLKNLLESEKK